MRVEPLAIIGIGCRLPGASSADSLYSNLLAGTNSIRAIPDDRALLKRHAQAREVRERIPDYGGFLDDMTAFDAALFRFSAREAEATDPQQRLILQVAWEALEDAAISVDALRGAYVPVFVGSLGTDYQRILFSDPPTLDLYGALNTTFGALAGRIAHCFDWSGPAVGLDTACSSALTAMHLACQIIWSGDAEVALFGATNVLLAPEPSLAYTRAGMLAPDGQCKAFDAQGDGFVRSEGAAAIIVKRLSAALRDGNPIYACVRATWLNHDGGRGQYKTPNRAGQRQMLEGIYARAGLSPLDTQYVEAHGTGTRAGDPVEVNAIGDVLCAGRSHSEPLYIGSVKTNIGHCEAAAGMASVIKTALSLRKRVIPANLHFHDPNPAIPWDQLALRVPTETTEWRVPADKVARAGVSSFGLTGVNAHTILEAAPEQKPRDVSGRATLWLLSAPDRERATLTCQRLQQSLARQRHALGDRPRAPDSSNPAVSAGGYSPELPADALVHSVARTLAVARKPHELRAALFGASLAELTEALAAQDATGFHEAPATAPHVCFVYSGQGGQWAGMGVTLLREYPAFAETFHEVSRAIEREAGFSPVDEVARPEAESRLHDHAIVQPTLFAMQVSLTALWRSFGVEPGAVVGHSMGEVSAAYVAGILDLETAVQVICRRSRIMKRAPGEGAMLVVDLPESELQGLIAQYAAKIALGVYNSPSSRVLSGDKSTLREIASQLEAKGAFARFVNVDLASHSPQMDAVKDELMAALAGVRGKPGKLAFHSTVRRHFGRRPQDGASFDAQYFWENLRHTVRFGEAVTDLVEQGSALFVEINPHPLLCQAITQTRAQGPQPTALASLRKQEDERSVMLRTAGELFVRGVPVRWRALLPEAQLLHLPPTPLRAERFEVDYSKRNARGSRPTNGVHALPVERIELPDRPTEARWRVTLDPSRQTLWSGHRVAGEIVFPAAGYLDLALSIAARVWGDGDTPLAPQALVAEQFRFERALYLSASEPTCLHVIATRQSDDQLRVEFATAHAPRHAEGIVRRVPAHGEAAARLDTRVDWASGLDEQSGFYGFLHSLGLQYTGPFRAVSQAFYGGGRGFGRIAQDGAALAHKGFTLHPAVLDVCFQLAFSSDAELRVSDPCLLLPTRLRSLNCYASSLADAQWVSAHRVASDEERSLVVDLDIWDANGRLIAQIEGFTATRLESPSASRAENLLWQLEWPALPLADMPAAEAVGPGRFVVCMDDTGLSTRVAELLEARGNQVVRVTRTLRANDPFEVLADGRVRMRADAPEHYQALLAHLTRTPGGLEGFLDFWPLLEHPNDSAAASVVLEAVQRVCMATVECVKALAEAGLRPRVWLFTKQAWEAQNTGLGPRSVGSALWGLGRVLAREHPELSCTLIDVSGEALELAKLIDDELKANSAERELRLSRDGRRVARLLPLPALTPAAAEVSESGSGMLAPYAIEQVAGQLQLLAASEPPTRPTDVVVEVEAFRAPHERDLPLPMVLGGRVCHAAAQGTENVPVGARVVWVRSAAAVKSVVAVPADEVWVLPDDFYLPNVVSNLAHYFAVFHALVGIGRLERGNRVLIVAPQNIALPAVYIARWARAQVVVLAAPEAMPELQRRGLRNLVSLQDQAAARSVRDAFLDARADLLFVAGELPKNVKVADILEADGRCVWLAHSDHASAPRVGENQTLHAVALTRTLALREPKLRESLQNVRTLLEHKDLPMLDFPTHKLDALRLLPRAAWGTVTLERARVAVERPPSAVRSDRSYLITGGLGGLGLAVANALADAGARSIIAIGRSAPSPEASAAIEALRERRVTVTTLQADVALAHDVERVLRYIEARLPPLAGIVHAAGVLADAIVLRQDAARFMQVFPAKVSGAWNLVRAMNGSELDFFVLFSSAAGLLGSPGQGNYAAANTWLDGLACALRARGVPAKSVQWGPWAEVGLAARPDRGGRLSSRGLPSLSPRAGADLFMQVLGVRATVVAAMRFEAPAWVANIPGAADDARLERVLCLPLSTTNKVPPPLPVLVQMEERVSAAPVAAKVREPAADGGGAVAILRGLIARLVHVSPGRIEAAQPITAHGLDSLMLVELRSAITEHFGEDVPIAFLVKGPSVSELAARLQSAPPAQAEPRVQPGAALEQTERELRRAVAELLRVSEQRVDVRKSIVAQGMDSLMLTELRTRVKERYNIDLPMAMLVKGPSVSALLEHLQGGAQAETASDAAAAQQDPELADPTRDLELPPDIQARASVPERTVRRVLVTGATGFLGRHLVGELLRRGADEVCCLVRGENDAAARARMHALLEPEVRALPGLRVLHADLEQPELGLGAARLRELMAGHDAVIHNAAVVHFGKSYGALRQANVGSWLHMLREAAATLPTLHLVSSWAVFSTAAHAGKPAREDDWPSQMPSSGYRESKFVGEMLARAAKERGFPVQVHRPALIGLHSQTGESNPKELFSALVTAVVQFGLAPDLDLAVPFAHVDAVAEGMARVVLDAVHTDFNYHWANQHSIDWHALLDWLMAEGLRIERMPYAEWRKAMSERVRGSALEPFITWLPEGLNEGSLGYLDAALRSSQPQPFDTTRTRALVPKLLDGPAIVPEAWRRFIQRARANVR